ncbi:sensor histidine kinase [Parerythrobacter jejuensis]|uniref:histidine kinase n=1 Tax=Parerythrobacter jejuensis TaxID=795812 RepID=A0A845AT15_9SPHN|nr:HAMP domain-containing sensor histidine kinase [Parerythrobacter jejuensis]MXP31981.1 hypothetical protein [Parerythrobacter jejuensis]
MPINASVERIDTEALYYFAGTGQTPTLDQARAALARGEFKADFPSTSGIDAFTPELWIAVRIKASAVRDAAPVRRILGLGGIFVVLPQVILVAPDGTAQEILATRSANEGDLVPRYLTYIRTASFDLPPGEERLVLINTTLADRPTLGVFREGELGRNQVVATLIKAGFTFTLLIIGIVLAVIAVVTKRRIGLLIAIGYSLVMIQVDASLYTTTYGATPQQGRQIWEVLTLAATFFLYYAFLFAFKESLGLHRKPLMSGLAIVLPLPLVWVAIVSDVTTDIIWAYYLSLLLFSCVIAFRFDIAPRLRLIAGAIMVACAVGAVLVEPFYLGRYLPDLTIEWLRDVLRLLAAMGILFMVLVDLRRTRRERDRMTEERIAALRSQADSDRKLLEAEREYVRAREAASRRKRQLAAASHDIRQPLVGLRQALASESGNISLPLQSRLGEAIDYLEKLTEEYKERSPQGGDKFDQEAEPYSLNLILRTVDDMFRAEAEAAGIALEIEPTAAVTTVPALALIRATSNLVANALRHAQPTLVRVWTEDSNTLKIVVEDDGRGMRTADIERLQRSGEKGEHSSGEGLGLAIIRELAERHDLSLELLSAPGEGTRAIIQLALNKRP